MDTIPPKRIPGTDQIYFHNPHTGDLVINLKNYPNLDDSIKNEDIVVVGPFTDYNGSGTKPTQEAMRQGLANELKGDLIAAAQGAEFDALTDRGNIASTHRQRPRLVHIDHVN